MRIIKPTSKELEKLCNRFFNQKKRIKDNVTRIIEDVRLYGDDALNKYTRRFDKANIKQRQLKVTEAEISAAFQNIPSDFISALKVVIENINRFYKKQLRRNWKIKDNEGSVLGEKFDPIDRVGVYIPAGTAPLVSCVYMTVLPAKLAGVKNIVMVSPPDQNGNINPYILAVASLLKVNEIYKVGGAQAIAALAFGTKTIPKVDKIIGPGNAYVAEAKRQVFGFVDIDMVAGPTELVVIANRFTDQKFVVSDLLAQKEHVGGQAILITPSKKLAKFVKSQIPEKNNGCIILVKNIKEAIEINNRIAPEHTELLINNPSKLLKFIRNTGVVFLGPYTPTAVGDYVAGPSHVLPTAGTARSFSGLSVLDFIRSTHFISYNKKSLDNVKGVIDKICNIEGLNKHWESVKARFE
ncbi:MAG: histidinol dehydrogenase [Candidatus Omnitrophica bacterium]|nr:histidinol dehydrogenase [Candidatus Omnitrophota bacterium]MDD5352599.1 histidinol dehydrogenase [Candidatus Omnitrophota bacterium]MDD5550197.1 histidinol dehydrogenase [Candidatus Omnitrophota bacterium]